MLNDKANPASEITDLRSRIVTLESDNAALTRERDAVFNEGLQSIRQLAAAQPTHSAECKADHDNAVCAPPLPDEVAQIVEELRTDNCQCLDAYKRRGRVDPQCQSCDTKDERNRAADLIERLARQLQEAKDWNAMLAGHNEQLAQRGDDLEERLARQVPDGCVVVPKKPTDIQINAAIYGGGKYATIYKAMIAAGEVKP